MTGVRFPRNILLHYLDHEVMDLYALRSRYPQNSIDEMLLGITRYAYLIGLQDLIVPCSSYFESIETQRLFLRIRPFIDAGGLKIIMSYSDVIDFVASKQSAQYYEDPSRYPSYSDSQAVASLIKLRIPVLDRTTSSTAHIRNGWVEGVQIPAGILQSWISTKNLGWFKSIQIEKNLLVLPDRLGQSAFIWPFVQQKLEFKHLTPDDERLFKRAISRWYIQSYLSEYDAAILRDLPMGTFDCGLDASEAISLSDFVAALAKLGLKQSVQQLSCRSLVRLKQSPQYSMLMALVARVIREPEISIGGPPSPMRQLGNQAGTQQAIFDKVLSLIDMLAVRLLRTYETAGIEGQPSNLMFIEKGLIVMTGDNYSAGQVGAMGPGAHAHNMTFQQVWNQIQGNVDLPALASELERLRLEMRKQATDAAHDVAIGSIAAAEVAARGGDGAKTLTRLKDAGGWALDVAKDIGVELASAVLQSALGIPKS
jgi:hypothetical protein